MVEWSAVCPSVTLLVDFVKSLSEGVRTDRGRVRAKSASGTLAAMKFVSFKLQLPALRTLLSNTLVLAWSVGQPTCERGGFSTKRALGGPQSRTCRCRGPGRGRVGAFVLPVNA